MEGWRRSWRVGADCKSVGQSLSRFESYPSHSIMVVSSVGRAEVSKTSGRAFEPCTTCNGRKHTQVGEGNGLLNRQVSEKGRGGSSPPVSAVNQDLSLRRDTNYPLANRGYLTS